MLRTLANQADGPQAHVKTIVYLIFFHNHAVNGQLETVIQPSENGFPSGGETL